MHPVPTISYHSGIIQFRVWFSMPEESLFLACATAPADEWTLHCVNEIAG